MKTPNYELLKDAYAIIGGIPEKAIRLHSIQSERGKSLDCGTICCAAGWLGHHPKFKAMGLGVAEGRYGTTMTLKGQEGRGTYADVMGRVFNIPTSEAERLFDSRTPFGTRDLHPNLSDKEVFLMRLRNYLKSKGQL